MQRIQSGTIDLLSLCDIFLYMVPDPFGLLEMLLCETKPNQREK